MIIIIHFEIFVEWGKNEMKKKCEIACEWMRNGKTVFFKHQYTNGSKLCVGTHAHTHTIIQCRKAILHREFVFRRYYYFSCYCYYNNMVYLVLPFIVRKCNNNSLLHWTQSWWELWMDKKKKNIHTQIQCLWFSLEWIFINCKLLFNQQIWCVSLICRQLCYCYYYYYYCF